MQSSDTRTAFRASSPDSKYPGYLKQTPLCPETFLQKLPVRAYSPPDAACQTEQEHCQNDEGDSDINFVPLSKE